MIHIEAIKASLFDANCYVVWSDESRAALVVDPGPGTADRVKDFCNARKVDPAAVLLTHGHADHIWEADAVAGEALPVFIPEPDAYWLDNPAALLGIDAEWLQLPVWNKPTNIKRINSLDFEPVPGIPLRMIPAPGHSPGSAVFLIGMSPGQNSMALSGDVVFAGSVGRTDLPGGDETEMRESLRTLAASLDPATRLLPGHGPLTIWADEQKNNAYVRRAVARQ